MCNYKLLADHVSPRGQYVEAGMDVGDDTPYPWTNPDGSDIPPSTQMVGLDDAGKTAVREMWDGLYGTLPPWEVPGVAESIAAKQAAYEEQLAADAASEPVSPEQTKERALAKLEESLASGNAMTPLSGAEAMSLRPRNLSATATASPTRGGVDADRQPPSVPQPELRRPPASSTTSPAPAEKK